MTGHASPNMTDIFYILATIGFFVVMLLFMWACGKI